MDSGPFLNYNEKNRIFYGISIMDKAASCHPSVGRIGLLFTLLPVENPILLGVEFKKVRISQIFNIYF